MKPEQGSALTKAGWIKLHLAEAMLLGREYGGSSHTYLLPGNTPAERDAICAETLEPVTFNERCNRSQRELVDRIWDSGNGRLQK